MKQVVAIVVAVLVLVSVSYAGNVSKAKDFIKAGMYPQAIELLDKEIHDNPTNAEAHFELGSCYVTQGRYGDADARFASAVRLKADYGYKIGGIYKTAGLSAADKGQTTEATTLLSRAIIYQPDLKAGLVMDMMSKGKTAVQQGKYGQADVRFAVAANLDQSARNEACSTYASLGDAADDKMCLNLYQKAAPYCGANEKIGNRLISIAKSMRKKPGMDGDVAKYKSAAAQFLGESAVQSTMPDTIVYQPGEYIFDLKAGEQTDNWITFPDGRDNEARFFIEKGSQYKKVYDDGTTVDMRENTNRLQDKFKIVATTNSHIRMVVK
jgi:Tfp pilus assembly protein PilF